MNTAFFFGFAGLLHDIGKLSQRARVPLGDGIMEMGKAGWHGNPRSHFHALHTLQFLEQVQERELSFSVDPEVSSESLAHVAARHHNPTTPDNWIVAAADRLSAGMDRTGKDAEDEIGPMGYRKTYLRSVFETVSLDEQQERQSNHRYRLQPFHSNNNGSLSLYAFPRKKDDLSPPEGDLLDDQFRALWNEFTENVQRLPQVRDTTPWDLFAAWMSLLEQYTWCVPSSTIDQPDISLYDHSVTTSGIAAVLASYHRSTNLWTESAIEDRSSDKFRLIGGDISGIQGFILGRPGEPTKKAAVRLRARSFLVQAISRGVALHIILRLQLPPSVIFRDAAGQFVIWAPNTDATREVVADIRRELDDWLIQNYAGELALNLTDEVTAKGEDFDVDKFHEGVISRVNHALEKAKTHKLSFGFVQQENQWNPERFVIPEFPPIENVSPTELNEYSEVNERLKDIGRCLPGTNYLIWRSETREGRRVLSLPGGMSVELSSQAPVMRADDLLIEQLTFSDQGVLRAVRRLPNHVPVFEEDDLEEGRCRRCRDLGVRECGESGDTNEKSIRKGTPRTFECLGKLALEKIAAEKGKEEWRGREYLGVLKADVDDLGQIFSRGLGKKASVSRYAVLSRMLHQFFVGHLQELMRSEPSYRHIYTVYAGGDDLFLVGPWHTMIAYAKRMYADFRKYTCHNPNITISGGLFISNSGYPIRRAATGAEEALEKSKQSGKDRFTLFSTTVRWEEFQTLDDWVTFFDKALRDTDSKIRTTFLHRLLTYREMCLDAEKGDLRGLLYHSHMRYDIKRNISRMKGGREINQDEIKRLQGLAADESLLQEINIPVYQVLYRHRGVRNDE